MLESCNTHTTKSLLKLTPIPGLILQEYLLQWRILCLWSDPNASLLVNINRAGLMLGNGLAKEAQQRDLDYTGPISMLFLLNLRPVCHFNFTSIQSQWVTIRFHVKDQVGSDFARSLSLNLSFIEMYILVRTCEQGSLRISWGKQKTSFFWVHLCPFNFHPLWSNVHVIIRKGHFNDAQVVDFTLTVAFLQYL